MLADPQPGSSRWASRIRLSQWLRFARAASLASLAALSGCASVGFVGQAAHGEWQLLHARRPIARIIANPATAPTLRARLQLVQDIRQFAVSDLGLPDNRSYRSYTDLRRPYVVWNVVAAPEFSVRPLQWCFPISGCVSYRGYFKERRARAFAAKLSARGDDVQVDGVTAFSTLGHFADPVLSTMLRYGDLDLAGTIFHELAHQLIYIPGDSEFDESFAMTVQAEGVSRWLAARGRSAELAGYLREQRLEDQIDALFAAGRTQLSRLYAESLPASLKRARKRAILAQVGERIRALEGQEHLDSGYDEWIKRGLNNASLASIGTYSDCVPGFEQLLRDNHGQLSQFYAAVRRIGKDPAARRALCRKPGGTPGTAPGTVPASVDGPADGS
ncbi:MAG TPA: aminopeptidase [Steroidobacteraceae bacterium]|jgi:predicted aminopeptidase|nr:aminopeptidase [Steroidobacteraceae bacterium]